MAELDPAGIPPITTKTGRRDMLKGAGGLALGALGASALGTARNGTTLAAPLAQDATPAATPAGGDSRPNIMFIMGDDIGWMQPSIYHRGLMVGETPNIDRIGNEGAMFTDYYAEQSCTAGRTAFLTGMNPLRVCMLLPEIPGSPS